MNVGFVRPSVSELALHLFGWSIHPELIAVRREETIRQADYTAKVRISEAASLPLRSPYVPQRPPFPADVDGLASS